MCYNVRNEYTVYLNIEVNFMCENTCCFIGHRMINETEELKSKLIEIIEKLIVDENIDTFLFGSKSRFCIFYYDEQNAPTTRKSGTKIALDYAIKQKKEIIRF